MLLDGMMETERTKQLKKIQMIPVDKLQPNCWNPNYMSEREYEELKEEIKHIGTLPKPVVVSPMADWHQIVDGEQEWKAAKELGFKQVPCEVRDISEADRMRETYKRNRHGHDDPVRLGKLFEVVMKKTGWSKRELAMQWNIGRSKVADYIMYAEAARLRDEYEKSLVADSRPSIKITRYFPINKLPIRKIRKYLALPDGKRDKWLNNGASYEDFHLRRKKREFEANSPDFLLQARLPLELKISIQEWANADPGTEKYWEDAKRRIVGIIERSGRQNVCNERLDNLMFGAIERLTIQSEEEELSDVQLVDKIVEYLAPDLEQGEEARQNFKRILSELSRQQKIILKRAAAIYGNTLTSLSLFK